MLIYNDACFELYGDKHPGALGSKGPDVFPKFWDEIGPLYDRVFAGDPLRLEARPWGDRPGGSLYDTFVAPGRNEAGHVEFVYVTAIEITDRVKTEAALRDNEEEYRTLLTSMSQGFCIIEKLPTAPGQPSDYRYILANPAFKQQTGLNDVVGKTTQDLFPDAKATFLDRYDDILIAGRSHVFQDYTDTVDRWIEVEAFAAQKPGQVAVLFSDISVKMRAEAALRESEKRQAFLLRLADAMRPLTDPIAVQEAAARMLGIELAVERCYYAEFDWPRDVLTISTEYLRSPSFSVTGEHPISAFQDLLRHSHEGEPLVCDEIAIHTLYRAEAAAYRERGTDCFILMPLVKEGTMVACLCVTMSVPRKWTSGEVDLVREVSERTWDSVGRARAEAELRTAEESHRAIFNGTSAGFLLLAPDAPRFTIVDVNEAYLSATMTRREDLIGRAVFEVFPENPDDPNATNVRDLRASLDRVLATKRRDALPRLKYEIPKPGGGFEERWWDPIQTPLLGPDGAVTAIIHHATEQTHVERAEAGLRKSEERFRALATAGATSVYRMSPDWRVMHQLDSTNFLSTVTESFEDWRERYILPADRAMVDTAIALAIRTGTMFDLEHRVVLADGGIGWVQSRAVPIRGKDGTLVEWFGAATNVTARKEAEAALRESEGKYRALFESIDQGFCVVEVLFDNPDKATDFRYLEANAAYLKHTGPINPVGLIIREAYPGAENLWAETFGRIVRTREGERFVDYTEAVNRWYDVFAFPTGKPNQNRVGVLFQDITERKRAEVALRESEERQAFLLMLSDALRPLGDAEAIQRVAARLTGERFGMANANYAQIETRHGVSYAIARQSYAAPGRQSVDGDYPLAAFPGVADRLQAGEMMVVPEIALDPKLTATDKSSYSAMDIANFLMVPLVKGGRLAAIFAVHGPQPQAWTEADVRLLEEVAERTWAAVERARAEAELRESEERLRHIVEGATEYAIVTLDAERRIMTWNSGAERILGYTETEARGQLADIFFIAEDLADGAAEREMHIAKTTGRAENERWHVRKDGSRFWGSGVMLPIEIDKKGHVIKIFRDRTDNRLAEERQQVLINELNHRVKNTLATVQAMASQTLRGSSVAHDISESFEARLLALANGHDVLTQQNWQGGELREIARIALEPFCTDDERVHIDGPSFYVKPKVALALTMAFHELATNATKYGALLNGSGRIDIAWTIDQLASRLRLRWAESGGPPVATPSRSGFGSRLIERSLAGELDAEARIEYALGGVVCTIDAPIATIVGADVGQGLG